LKKGSYPELPDPRTFFSGNSKGRDIMGKRHMPLWFFIFFILLAGCQASGSGGQEDEFIRQIKLSYPDLNDKNYETAIVKRVIDGDTFETDDGQKVRLIGVNTPEISGQAEYYGKEASEFSRQRLSGEKVYMFSDVGDKDRYGRLLRYIFIDQEPVMFNEILLIEGYANVMTVPPNVRFAEKFVTLEREARENQKGLWLAEGGEDRKVQKDQKGQPNPKTQKQDTQSQKAQTAYPCSEPKIKGNINSKKEKIYHVPGSRYYESTIAEEMFCTEEQAIAAGYRKAKGS
jgi:micrococcal nuclease